MRRVPPSTKNTHALHFPSSTKSTCICSFVANSGDEGVSLQLREAFNKEKFFGRPNGSIAKTKLQFFLLGSNLGGARFHSAKLRCSGRPRGIPVSITDFFQSSYILWLICLSSHLWSKEDEQKPVTYTLRSSSASPSSLNLASVEDDIAFISAIPSLSSTVENFLY